MHPNIMLMWMLANWPDAEVMEAAVDEFLLSLGLNPGPSGAYG